MTRNGRIWRAAAAFGMCIGLGLALPAPAVAGDQAKGFGKFCSKWMGKLQKRETNNLTKAKAVRRGDHFVMEYVGYADKPVRCETKATGVASNPYVGKLVYHELKLKKTGAKRAAARGAKANVVARTEILEIFRFDGSRWVY